MTLGDALTDFLHAIDALPGLARDAVESRLPGLLGSEWVARLQELIVLAVGQLMILKKQALLDKLRPDSGGREAIRGGNR